MIRLTPTFKIVVYIFIGVTKSVHQIMWSTRTRLAFRCPHLCVSWSLSTKRVGA